MEKKPILSIIIKTKKGELEMLVRETNSFIQIKNNFSWELIEH